MNKPTPYITEEHIVAWLDGEVEGHEFDAALSENIELARAASDYAGLSGIFMSSLGDKRFTLSARADARVRASLKNELAHSRKTVRVASPAPFAMPVRSAPGVERFRKIWVRRSAVALVFGVLIALFWFNARDNATAPSTAMLTAPNQPAYTFIPKESQAVQNSVPVTPDVSSDVASLPTSNTHSAVKHHEIVAPSQVVVKSQDVAVNSSQASKPAAQADEDTDPAAIMASHRFAKLVKTTPTVVITDQDKM